MRCAVASLLAPSVIQRCKLLLWIQADAHQSLTTALRCRVTFFWILFTDQIDREGSLFASGRWYSKVYRGRSSARNTLSEEMKEIYQVSQIFSLSEVRWLKAKHTLNLSNRTESAGGPVSPHHLVGRVKVEGLYFLELFSTSSTKEEGIWPWSEALSGLAFQPTQGYSRFLKLLLLLLSSLMSDLWHSDSDTFDSDYSTYKSCFSRRNTHL